MFSRINFFIDKFGFILILTYCLGLFTPDFESKNLIMDLDLENLKLVSADGSFIKQFFWISSFTYYLIRTYLHINKSNCINYYLKNVFYIIFVLIMCLILSLFFSEYKVIGLKRVLFQFLLVFTIMFSIFFSTYSNGLVKSVEISITIFFIFIFYTIVTGVGFTNTNALAGYLSTKNVLAANSVCLLVIYSYAVKFENLKTNVFFTSVLFIILLLTQSKTVILLYFIFLLLNGPLVKFCSKIIVLTLVINALLFIYLPYVMYLLGYEWNVGIYFGDDFLTGRGAIWNNLYYDLFYYEKYNFGYGYGTFFGMNEIPYFLDIKNSFLRFVSSAHNGYIELFLQLGALGCTLLFIFIIFITAKLKNKFFYPALIIPVLQNITESSFLRDQNIIWLLFIFILSISLIFKFRSASESSNCT